MSMKDLWPDSSDEEYEEDKPARRKVIYVRADQVKAKEEDKTPKEKTDPKPVTTKNDDKKKPQHNGNNNHNHGNKKKEFKKGSNKKDFKHHQRRKFDDKLEGPTEPTEEPVIVSVDDPTLRGVKIEVGFFKSHSLEEHKKTLESLKGRAKLSDEQAEKIFSAIAVNFLKEKPSYYLEL